MAVRYSPQDCIFFESTEELYKFRIKVPNTELYVREKHDERAWKDGSHSDKGIVWEFDKQKSNSYYIKSESNWYWKAYIHADDRLLKIKPTFDNDKNDRHEFTITECL